MKIIVFGASGGTGLEIVKQALEAGHSVTAFVRNPVKLGITHPDLRLFQGDVLDAAAVENAVAGQDAVISALGPTRPQNINITSGAFPSISLAMDSLGVPQIAYSNGNGDLNYAYLTPVAVKIGRAHV